MIGEHTPAPWTWWTSNSWRRLKHEAGGESRNVLTPYVCRDGQPDIAITEADMALVEAAPDLLAACKAQHNLIDRLAAMLINLTSKDVSDLSGMFRPMQMPGFKETVMAGNAAVAKAERSL